ncbi:hypothetical protein LNTAR_22964 [Lentisphaera araneosa HTCC2155]|uniref:Cytochrome c domain-containing protein n=1 Tax=Lentisphaera araneosa HTCC2155 TaxID=313628 RepID=A6DGI4_9BACT|nr:family 16 glycoside hydrolase [Lentisphaera araneosa]EDM29301.1 hypothetical protein LNTAR_22964 [Lentisphaera araneosa HTCC2155]
MMHNFKLSCLLFFLIAQGMASPAQDLFNGNNLAGWKGDLSYWSVKDGVIFGQSTKEHPTGGTFLVWDGEVADFEITLQARVKGNNSGLQYRSKIANAQRFTVNGYQADIIDANHLFGMMYHQGEGRGIVAQRFQQVAVDKQGKKTIVKEFGDKNQKWDASQWNEYRVIAVGNRLIHQVNGVTTVDVTDDHPNAARKGILALQLHGGAPMTAEFKDIKLRKVSGADAQQLLKKTLAQKDTKSYPYTQISTAPNFLANKKAQWIWKKGKSDDSPLYLTQTFNVKGKVKSAHILSSCDNEMKLWLNGELLHSSKEWNNAYQSENLAQKLKMGSNLLAVEAKNAGGLAAFMGKIILEFKDGKTEEIVSDLNWKASETAAKNWQNDASASAQWSDELLTHGDLGVSPWGQFGLKADNSKGGNTAALKDFKIQEIFKFPHEYGSQVAMAVDDQGRLYVSGQKNMGLYRMTLNPDTEQFSIVKMPLELKGTRGMVWHKNSLYYYFKNGGLMRLWDSNGDDMLDSSELYQTAFNGSEHGSHSVVVAQDQKDFYLVGGNHTPKPKDEIVSFSRVQSWDEDLLLEREWDGNNHARGVYAPGGHITRYNPETKKNEIFAIGFRNQFDIAFNAWGDMFTYDADMEWDMGTPWYRPTRINFVASGSDYGWRSGSGKWPAYYEDSLPSILDIGPGSPTGMVSGVGAKFPAKYQKAVYAFDWTYGTVHALHLKTDGAGYKAERESFAFGEPMPLTDGLIGKDGAMYFLTGGRGTDSRLYRVSYEGSESTAPIANNPSEIPAIHQLRRKLETFHGVVKPNAIAEAWPHLSSTDRWLRHAARVAIESQPVDDWKNKVFTSNNPQATITGAVALARMGSKEDQDQLIKSLLKVKFKNLQVQQKLGLLRAYALTFIRMGEPKENLRQAVIKQLDPRLPAKEDDLNTELLRVLVYLKAPGIIEKGMALIERDEPNKLPEWQGELLNRNKGYARAINKMINDYPPVQKLGYAFILRNLKTAWTLDQRRTYISFLNSAAKHPGGNSYAKFLMNIRGQVLTELSKEDRLALTDITGEDFNAKPKFKITAPKGPGRMWTVKEASQFTHRGARKKADLKNGRNLFHAAACASCHRFDGLGGDIGPDLSMVRTKFDDRYLLESIIEPSKNISDQYSSKIITLKDKTQINGLVMPRELHYDVYPTTKTNKEVKPKQIPFDDVVKIEDSPYSQMPPMLINSMNKDEIRDLIAYLLSTGIKE